MIPVCSLIILSVLSVLVNANSEDSTEKVVLCNFVPKSIHRPGPAIFNLEELDPTLCTHIIYNRATINGDTHEIKLDRPEMNFYDNGGYGFINRTMKLKEKNPQLKVLLRACCIGELFQENSTMSRDLISSKFNKDVVELMKLHGFDGLFLDLNEQPDLIWVTTALRQEFDKQGYTLAKFVYPPTYAGKNGSLLTRAVAEPCHLLIVGSFWHMNENSTGVFSPTSRMRGVITKYLDDGIPPEKLVVPIPSFALTYTICEKNDSGLYAEICGPGTEGTTEAPPMVLQYYELMYKMRNASEGWVVTRDDVTGMLYGHSNSYLWASFEDTVSVRAKAQYILEKNLAGIAIMNVDNDDFPGYNEEGIKFLLTKTAHDALHGN